jgi:hypothetical protein
MQDQKYYVVSAHPNRRYVGCNRSDPKAPSGSNWFITDQATEAYDVGNRMEALEVCNELNGKHIEAVYDLVDPEHRHWTIVEDLGSP